MNNPLITVLMPVFNGEKYLREAIESILDQSISDFEYLIINDGSGDKSIEIIKEFTDPRIKLINNKCNMGLIYSLNRGLELANGKYIARMDSDDISLRKRFEKQIKYLEKHKDVGICGSWVQAFNEQNSITWKYPESSEWIKAQLLFNCDVIAHPATMIRKDFLIKYNLKYDDKYQFAEDWALWLRASKIFKISNVQSVLLKYRLHSSNLSITNSKKQKTTIRIILKEELNNLGIEASDNDIDLHRWIDHFDLNIANITKYEKWLIRLLDANKTVKIYPQNYLIHVIANKWFNILYHSKEMGYWKLKKYFVSSVPKKIKLSRYEIINKYKTFLFILRCMNEKSFFNR